MTSAARIRSGSFTSEARKAWAVPWKLAWMLAGMRISRSTSSIARTAPPSETPGARLNDSVVAGNCPWWLIASGTATVSARVNAVSGTSSPLAERT